MQMSDDEIKVSYQQAKNQAAQVDILAALNGIGRSAMAAKLESLGVTVPPRSAKRPRTFTFEAVRALELYHGGQSDLEIAEQAALDFAKFTKTVGVTSVN